MTEERRKRGRVKLTLPLCGMWLVAIILSVTSIGSYLNRNLFLHPLNKIRSAAGLTPALDPRIKLVLLDDSSYLKLGRAPTFGEWRHIAATLHALGVKRVILHGFHSLKSEVGYLPALATLPKGFFAVAVASAEAKNVRATPVDKYDAHLMQPMPEGLTLLPTDTAESLLGPSAEIQPEIDAIGDIYLMADDQMRVGIQTAHGKFIPNLGLLAAPELRLPHTDDGRIYLDFVDRASVFAAAVNASAFFTKDTGELKEPSQALKDKLVGAEVVVLIPDATSGTRQVDSPVGLVPSFVSTVSLMSAVLADHYKVPPIPMFLAICLTALASWFLLLIVPPRATLWALAAVPVLQIPVSAVLYHVKGWVLPSAECFLVGMTGFALVAVYRVFNTLAEKVRLSRDLELGRTVQALILPDENKGRIGAYEYEVRQQPLGLMSGDWLQIYRKPGTIEGVIAIGDVVGKGPSAALNTAAIACMWHAFCARWDKEEIDVTEFIATLDAAIRATFKGQQNTTLSLAHVAEERVTLFSYGAPNWMKVAGRKAADVLLQPMNPLGGMSSSVWQEPAPFELGMKDVLVAYSDGVLDGSRDRHQFVKAIRLEAGTGPLPDGRVLELLQKVSAEGREKRLPDDATILVLKRAASSRLEKAA